ncbi:MAG: CHASE3 domain-containing protein, partial [Bryobacteraceae bacterium]
MSTSIQRRTIHTFALVALVPVLLTGVAYRCQSEFRDDVEWVRRTHQILNRIETVLNLVNEAETGQRGFLITGDNAYLQPYEAAKQQIPGQVRELRRQLAQDPPGDRLAGDLEDEIGEKFRELGLTITTRRAKGAEAAFGVVKSNRGQEIMEQIRETVDAMRSHEGDLLEQRVSAERTTAALFTAAFVLGSLVTVVLLVWALRTIRHYEAETETATIAVRSLNDELERRVEVRTQELQRSNEDLQRFAYVASHDL